MIPGLHALFDHHSNCFLDDPDKIACVCGNEFENISQLADHQGFMIDFYEEVDKMLTDTV